MRQPKIGMNETAKRTMNENANKTKMRTQIPNVGTWPWALGPEHGEIDKVGMAEKATILTRQQKMK